MTNLTGNISSSQKDQKGREERAKQWTLHQNAHEEDENEHGLGCRKYEHEGCQQESPEHRHDIEEPEPVCDRVNKKVRVRQAQESGISPWPIIQSERRNRVAMEP